MLEIIVGGGVGAVVMYLWVWRRVRYVHAFWRGHKRSADFERVIRRAREDIAKETVYRAATTGDGELVALLSAARADQTSLQELRFTTLGDLVLETGDTRAIVRALVDGARTTVALLMITSMDRARVHLHLATYGADEMFAARRGPQAGLAEPPFVHRQLFPADTTVVVMVERHRAFVQHDGAQAIGTLDDLIAQLTVFRTRSVAWREMQPPDELLDADLKCVLGDLYPRIGKTWARRLRGRLPEATALRVPAR